MLYNYLKLYKKNIAIKLSITDIKLTAEDQRALNIPGQTFLATQPYLIFTPQGLQFASDNLSTPTILCTNADEPLEENLALVRNEVRTQTISLESAFALIKELLHHILRRCTNYTLQRNANQMAKLYLLREPDPLISCMMTQISIALTLTNQSLPSLVTALNLKASTTLLEDRLTEAVAYSKKVHHILNLLNQPTATPPLTITYSIQSYSDLFSFLPTSSPTHSLIIILFCSIARSVLLLLLLFCLFLLLIRRGSKLLSIYIPQHLPTSNCTFNGNPEPFRILIQTIRPIKYESYELYK